MLFCPTCSNLLLTEMPKAGGVFRFYCKTCPYVFGVENKFEDKMLLEKKEVDAVLGGAEQWKDA